ncbi:MAG: hypothetical protein ACOX52_15300 [Verrucomicrobiota bacterium]
MPTRTGIDFDWTDRTDRTDRIDRPPLPEGAGLFGRASRLGCYCCSMSGDDG